MAKMTEDTLDHVAYRFKLMGEPMRLKIIYLLKDGEQCVQDLVEKTGAGQANISKHLSLLASNGIVSRRKEGLHVYYYIEDRSIFDLCDTVCGSLENSVKNLHKVFKNT
ncbi:MAG TPA: metalloregulator ArsR/SmtB family transcription factor [Balneolales bacterium]|nr:metalloregulator ArsR/SmtB family transcription factor [Balneolales bacterium]